MINNAILNSLGLPNADEFHFAESVGRKYRFDFALIETKIAIELNGGIWKQLPSHSGKGHIRDMEKINLAIELGWVVLQYEPTKISYSQIERVFKMRGGKKNGR